MKFRVGTWAAAGLRSRLLDTLRPHRRTSGNDIGDPILALVQLTFRLPFFALTRSVCYTVLLANAATYASVGFLVEILRQKQKIRQAR